MEVWNLGGQRGDSSLALRMTKGDAQDDKTRMLRMTKGEAQDDRAGHSIGINLSLNPGFGGARVV